MRPNETGPTTTHEEFKMLHDKYPLETLQRILLTHLRPHFEGVTQPRRQHRGFKRLAGPCEQVFSALVAASSNADASAERAFAEVVEALQLSRIQLLSFDDQDGLVSRIRHHNVWDFSTGHLVDNQAGFRSGGDLGKVVWS